MIDLSPAFRGEAKLNELTAGVTKEDLRLWTNEMINEQRTITADAVDADVVFVPVDPAANDTFAGDDSVVNLAWTLGHVVVHATASSEESAALALTLARGLPVEGRSRYETPWETVTTVEQIVARLEESRRMRLAMLDAWPESPDLEISYEPWPGAGSVNATARFVLGLGHDTSHIEQLREIMRQARTVRSA